jgi:signal transduction histidine kinase
MSEKEGRFEKGRWVEGEPAPAEEPATEEPKAAPEAERLLDEASQSVHRAVDDVIRAGRHLFGTQEGREHIEKKIRKAGDDLEKVVDDAVDTARQTLEKRKK